MSTEYPILDDRPINKWKVTELKEELKRRNLKVNGLKDELVKRLDEAIRNERGTLDVQERDNSADEREPVNANSTVNVIKATEPTSAEGASESNKIEEDETVKSPQNDTVLVEEPTDLDASVENSGTANVAVDTTVDNEVMKSSSVEALKNNEVKTENEVLKHDKNDNNYTLVEEPVKLEVSVESSGIFPVEVNDPITPSDTVLQDTKTKLESDAIGVASAPSGEKPLVNQDAECDVSSPGNQPHDLSYPSNQVHEVSANIESQVKSESICTDTLSFNDKKELKDNLNADNVQLEPEVVGPELVQPLSSENLSHNGIFHRLDDGMPGGNPGFVGEIDDQKSRNMEVREKNVNTEINTSDNVGEDNKLMYVTTTKYSSPELVAEPERMESSAKEKPGGAVSVKERNSQVNLDDKSPDFDMGKMAKVPDGDHLEKINLEQSSADDSMDDDVVEARHSNQNAAEVSKKGEPMDVSGMIESGSNDAMHTDIPSDMLEPSLENEYKIASDIPSDNLELFDESKDKTALVSDKRRLQAAADENAPAKRQRRWNSENVRIPEQQSSGVSVTTTPKKLFHAVSEKPNRASSNSSLSEDTPKERIVPPSVKTPTNSLRIDNFVRPFTLKAVQELLAKTGKVCSFWMDQIKTHCYVTYSTIEESIETRNAVYNLQWPTNGGRLLVADFVDPEEVKQRIESPLQSKAPPATTTPPVVPTQNPSQPPQPREQGPNKPSEPRNPLSRERPASGAPRLHERLSQPTVTAPEEVEPPTVTLDDLFRKTKATPRIYYLPLSDEQVAAKLQKKE